MAQSSTGAPTKTWADFATVSGVMGTKSEQEKFREGSDQVWSEKTFYMDYVPGVLESHRVLCGPRKFNIVGITNPGEMNKLLKLDLREIHG